ncbi:hypothetical protein ACFPT7_19810 [Acidicapsa dinghuensis]|uniref:Secreted protein n=1 Tax=Acidicapsa dinghuensis TaxID=2218256 RepID=A0ABW1EKQ4_9BACT|nr:hypothetical protein [Acidicapsa dinghuensis]
MARRKRFPTLPLIILCGVVAPLPNHDNTAFAQKQIIIVNTQQQGGIAIDRRYAQIEPTKVNLSAQPIDARGHQDILRVLTAEQGFAMRPLPRGKKGLTLEANGKLSPAGMPYVNQVNEQGLSVKPGGRIVISNIRIEKEKIVFDMNDGPDRKHEFLRHVEIGVGGSGATNPIVQDDGTEPTGTRVTLVFHKYVPEVTPAQVKALLSPLISFDMKTPVQAYTDTLPPQLKKAILDHHVMVGMNTDMVLYALGHPDDKSREIEGQTPFEEWIYGHPPEDVTFVRINGNRVIRVEIARTGQPLEIYTKDEVEGLMTTDGRPVLAAATQQHTIELGDVHRNADTQAPAPPPTLRAPGEKLPDDKDSNTPGTMNREGPMKPVIFPKDTTNDPAHTVDAHPEKKQPAQSSSSTTNSDSAAKPSSDTKSGSDAKPDSKSKDDAKPTDKPRPDYPGDTKPGDTKPQSNFYSSQAQPSSR